MADGEHNSASVANSRIHHHGVAPGFMPMFQTLNSWESDPHPRLLSGLGVALEMLQLISFTLCPYFLYEQPAVRELVQTVWATAGPLWYKPFGPFSVTAQLITVIICFLICFATLTTFVLLCLKKIESTNITVTYTTRCVAEILAGCLFIPVMHLFLAGMGCSDSELINFPGEACGTGQHAALIGVGVVGTIILAAIGLLISTTLCDTNPQSTKLRSRSHNYVEAAVLVAKVVLVIFFHILVERGATASYNIIAVITFVTLLALHCVVLPFYHQQMTSIRCAALSVAAFVGIVNCVTAYCAEWFHTFHINSFVLAAFIPFAAHLGYILSSIRVNAEFTERLSRLLNDADVPAHHARFPFVKGIMSNDVKMAPMRFRSLENDILSESTSSMGHRGGGGGDQPTWEETVVSCSETLVPYIEDVKLPTDAEVASRFVQAHISATNLSPSANILAFATRMFLKNMVHFKRSGIARFHFANFLYVYVNRLNLALELLNEIDQQVQDEHDALVLYSSFKVGVRVKELFGVRDNTHIHTFQRARQYHKDAMAGMCLFWGKLMESKGDIVGLALLTNQLTERRQNALDEYERALTNQKGDRLLLSAYASFLENVMCDEQGAEGYRQLADDVAEEKKNRIMRGSRSKSDVVSTARVSSLQIDDDDEDEDNRSDSTTSLLTTLAVFLSLVALCSVGVFVVAQVRSTVNSGRIGAISSIGTTRGYAEETFLYGILANRERIAAGCTNGTCTASTFREALYNLSQAEVNMRFTHNKATYGEDASGRTSGAMKFVSGLSMTYREYMPTIVSTIFSFFGNPASRTFSSLLAEGTASATPTEPWMYVHSVSMTATELVNRMYDGTDFGREFLQLTSNTVSESLYALGDFSEHHITDLKETSSTLITALIAIFIAGSAILLLCFLAFYSSLRGFAYTKATSLKLFTLIPYPTQELLQQGIVSKMEQFEKMNADDGKDVGGDHEEDNLGDVPEYDPLSDEQFADEQQATRNPNRRESHRFGSAQHQAKDMKGLDDDVRRMSRFFGGAATRSTSIGNHPVAPSILKHPVKSKNQAPKKKKRVQFKIDGEVHPPGRKLREPKVKLTSKANDLVLDLERSLKDMEQQSLQESQREKMRKERETEKMIHGGMRSQQGGHSNKHNASPNHKQDQQANTGFIVGVALGPIACACLLAACVLTSLGSTKLVSINTDLMSLLDYSSTLNSAKEDYQRFQLASIYYANFGYSEHHVALNDYAVTRRGFLTIKNQIAQGYLTLPSSMYDAIDHATSAIEYVVYGIMSDLSVAVRALAGQGRVDLSTAPVLAAFQNADTEVTNDFLITYPDAFRVPEEYVFNGTLNTTSIPGLSADAALSIALRRMTSLKAFQDDAAALDAIDSVQSGMDSLFQGSVDEAATAARLDMAVAAILAAVAFALTAGKLFLIVRSDEFVWSLTDGPLSPRLQAAAAAFTLVLSIIVVGLSASETTKVDNLSHDYVVHKDALATITTQRDAVYHRHRNELQRILTTGNALTLHNFVRGHSTTSVATAYDPIIAALDTISLGGGDLMQTLITSDLFVFHMQQVSMWLYTASKQRAANQTVSPPSPPFLATYDYNQEVGSAADTVLYTTDASYQYSTPAADKLRVSRDLWFMSRFAATGRRSHARFFAVYDTLADALYDGVKNDAATKLTSESDKQKQVAVAATVCAAIGLVLIVMVTFASLIEQFVQNVFSMDALTKSMMENLFASTLRKCVISLSILGCIFIAQFVVAVIVSDMGEQAGMIVQTARDREYLVTKSLSTAIKANASIASGNGFEVGRQTSILTNLRSQLSSARNQLYFAASATSSAFDVVSSLSTDQRAITFQGGTSSLDNQYLVWLTMIDSITSTSHSISSTLNPNNTLANLYTYAPTTQATFATLTSQLLSAYFQLISKVRESNAQYDKDMGSTIDRTRAPDVILLLAVLCCIVIQIYAVFVPVGEQLHSEERGTHLMLNMIPQSVRDLVPKISMYLDSGYLVQEADERKMYSRCPKSVEFLSLWSHESDRMLCFELLNQSSIGQILIDTRGIVLFANKHVPALIGYDDLEGRNISCLLDEPLRSLHDGFLKRYVTAGNSRIIGSGRDVVARCKNGDAVHLYLNLDEAVSSTGQQFFLGGLERYSLDDVKNGRKQVPTVSATELSENAAKKRESVAVSNLSGF